MESKNVNATEVENQRIEDWGSWEWGDGGLKGWLKISTIAV